MRLLQVLCDGCGKERSHPVGWRTTLEPPVIIAGPQIESREPRWVDLCPTCWAAYQPQPS